MKKLGRILLGTLGVLALTAFALVALGASAWLHLQQTVGRRALGDAIGGFASSQMPGSLRVEGVRTARLPLVEVDRLRVRTAGGMEVMDLRDVSTDLDVFASAYHGGPIFRRADVGGGEISIVQSPNGKPWIERAFARRSSSSSSSGKPWWAPPGRFVMRLEDASYESIRLMVEAGGTEARLTDASGRARIWLPDRSDVQMRFWGVSGRLQTSTDIVPTADVHGLALTVDPTGPSTVRFASGLDALDADMTVAGHVPSRDGSGGRMCLWTGGAPLASLFGVGAEVGTSLFTDVSFDMRPSEAPSRPRCREES